jgi:solute carrier family 25 oxoglutarate transporter 11
MSVAQLALIQAKELLEDMGLKKGGNAVVLGGAMIAGFFASACSLPFDYVKTQVRLICHYL